MGMCCDKKTLIGWRNVWNMRWRAPDQRGHGKRLCKKIAKHIIWTRRMLWIVVDGRTDKDWMMIRMVGRWVFLLVPAHPGSPGQRAIKRLLLCCVEIYQMYWSIIDGPTLLWPSQPNVATRLSLQRPYGPAAHCCELYVQWVKKTSHYIPGHNFCHMLIDF